MPRPDRLVLRVVAPGSMDDARPAGSHPRWDAGPTDSSAPPARSAHVAYAPLGDLLIALEVHTLGRERILQPTQ